MELKIPFMEDSQLPSFEHIKKAFEELDLLYDKGMSYEELKNAFLEKLSIFPQLIYPEGKLNLPIYRTSIINSSELDIRHPDSFSHPPPNYCSLGRCNLNSHPVFYGSISEDTALREKRKANDQGLEEGDEVYVSQWQVNSSANFRYSQFIFGNDVELGEVVSDLNSSNIEKLANMSTPYSEDKQKGFKHLVHKMGSYFLLENYNFSSFLAHYLLFDNREKSPLKADAIIYPSVQSKLTNFNIAIHPDFVRNHMKLVNVKKIRFKGFEKEGCRCELLEIGIVKENGLIDWNIPRFSTDTMDITGIEIAFVTEPHIDIYNPDHIFKKKGCQMPLGQITWEYINTNKVKVLELLSKVDVFDYDRTYQKELYIQIPKNNLWLEFEDEKYFIETLKVNVHYKIALLSKVK